MASSASSPTARRWELSARLRDLRTAAGRSIDEAAAELLCSPAKISRMETGGRGILPRDVRDLCRFYGVSDEVRDSLMTLAVEARKPGWWHDFRTIDEQTATFVGLESAATELRVVETRVVPGLLQTPAMTRAILGGVRPPGELTEPWIDETVALREKRQNRLTAGDLSFSVVIDEVIFAREIAPPDAITAQIDRLIALTALPRVSIQVVPFSKGAYPGIDGSYQHLRFNPATLNDMVYVEGLLGNFFVEKTQEVQHYLDVFDYIVREVALSTSDTIHWLNDRRDQATKP